MSVILTTGCVASTTPVLVPAGCVVMTTMLGGATGNRFSVTVTVCGLFVAPVASTGMVAVKVPAVVRPVVFVTTVSTAGAVLAFKLAASHPDAPAP